MARKANNPTLVMLVQEIRPELWTQGDDPAFAAKLVDALAAKALPKDDPGRVDALREAAAAIAEHVVAAWEADGRVIEEVHANLHPDDEQEEWDEATQSHVKVIKFLHLHLLVKFRDRVGSAPLERLAALAGVAPQYLELDKSRGGAPVQVCGKRITQQHDNGLAYLIHIKYPEKAQYPPEQVASLRGMDYMQIYRERRAAWLAGRAHIKKKRAARDVEELRERVLNGELTRTQIMLTDELFEVYSRYTVIIDDALNAYGQRRAYKAAQKLRNGDFCTSVVFVHGPAGVGKTRFATDLIQTVLEQASKHGERWELYRAATANPLDDWRGEEIVLLDDLRASAMDANDWLLLLDPYNASPARARYRNKSEVAPRLIVITATIEPVEFFFYARQKGQVDEALDQFIRRLASIVRVFRVDDVARYLVQKTGQVRPYTHVIERSDREGRLTPELLQLEYGVVDEIEHTAEGARSQLMLGLAHSNGDIPWSAADDWADHEARVSEAVEAKDRKDLEVAAAAARRLEIEQDAEIARLEREIAELPARRAREAEQRKRLAAEREASERRATFDRLASKGFIIPTGSRR